MSKNPNEWAPQENANKTTKIATGWMGKLIKSGHAGTCGTEIQETPKLLGTGHWECAILTLLSSEEKHIWRKINERMDNLQNKLS